MDPASAEGLDQDLTPNFGRQLAEDRCILSLDTRREYWQELLLGVEEERQIWFRLGVFFFNILLALGALACNPDSQTFNHSQLVKTMTTVDNFDLR